MHAISIEELKDENLDQFLAYLKVHLSENGDNSLFFQPISKAQSKFSPDWETKFRVGLRKEFGEKGWRKLWIAINEENQIVGHIDIRSRNEPNTGHRVLLGMGTDSKFRNLKIGQRLIAFVIAYCKNQPDISWLDLEVLTSNIPAIRIYKKLEFQILGSVKDMFRIENQSYDYTSMTLNVESEA
ncbi:MAG: GNAT family N-acetyltransferase [Saprospiraceae bacterium]